jgi:hypothetical protein
MNLLGARFVSGLLFSPLIADDPLIGTTLRLRLRLWHAFLPAMFAALILQTFKVVFFWHRNPTLPSSVVTALNAIEGRSVPP